MKLEPSRLIPLKPIENLEPLIVGTVEPCKPLKRSIREILTCWLLLKMFVVTSNRVFFFDPLIIFVRSKTDHYY